MSVSNGDEIVLVAHLPLVTIEEESVAFAGGDLWRMPFENFDALTLGAYADHRKAYEATAPVFLRVVVPVRLPNVVPLDPAAGRTSSRQMKLPADAWSVLSSLGLDIVRRFHAHVVHPAWHALLLQAPSAVLPPPRWSLTCAVADPGFGFAFDNDDQPSQVISVQGDADLEYLINEGFPVVRFEGAALDAAREWAERLSDRSSIDPGLWPALEALGDGASPLLGEGERTVLATMALESLLLPEVRSGLSATLERRLSHLLARDDGERQRARSSARSLYKARSASVHGEAPSQPGSADEAGPGAWLAAAIMALDRRCRATAASLNDVLARLDEDAASAAAPGSLPAATRPCAPALLRRRIGVVAIVAPQLESPEDGWLLWAPLAGLVNHQPMALDPERRRLLLSLTGHELLQLEERDVARDFAGQLRMREDGIAALCIAAPALDDDAGRAIEWLQQERDLAVAALRLAGLHDFCDPALAGPVAMRGPLRHRQPSVLRQSVWQLIARNNGDGPAVRPEHGEPIASVWRVVDDYRRAGAHPELDRALSLYRRGFDRRFGTPPGCARLHFATIESLLGRFRALGDPMPLEALVARLLGEGDASAAWFAREARSVRNAVAHGGSDDVLDAAALDALATIAGSAWRRAAQLYTSDPSDPMRPSKRLTRALTD